MEDGRDRSRSPRNGSGDDDILSLIYEREKARASKDWAQADQLRERLTQLGVTLFDKTNAWRAADGRSGRIPTWSELEGGQPLEALQEPKHFSQLQELPGLLGGEGLVGDGNEAHIKQLVQMREQARAAQDFAQADKIRDDLKALGVELFDKEKMWRAKNGLSGVIIGYRGVAGPTDVEISALVLQREKARQSGDWQTADLIREELKQFRVEIMDKEKVWRTPDGRSGPVPLWGTVAGGNPGVVQIGMGLVGASQIVGARHQVAHQVVGADFNQQLLLQALVQKSVGMEGHIKQLVQMREQARAAQDFGQADRIRDQLKGLGVEVFDKEKMWRSTSGLSGVIIGYRGTAGPTDVEISTLVQQREKARQSGDWKTADLIRDELKQFRVEILDKEKVWRTPDGRTGPIPLWGNAGANPGADGLAGIVGLQSQALLLP